MTDKGSTRAFVDTNILVYALVRDDHRTAASEKILAENPVLSVQVLNECVDVLRRKLHWSWDRIEADLILIEELCGPPVALTHAAHRSAVEIAKRYNIRIYDALILAAALEAGCATLYSEDMHSGQKVRSLTIRNPFTAA
ncbi:MAG: PIN domain-containing protein [Acidobacteriaceae bacterium]